jgi:hypothetical protein
LERFVFCSLDIIEGLAVMLIGGYKEYRSQVKALFKLLDLEQLGIQALCVIVAGTI